MCFSTGFSVHQYPEQAAPDGRLYPIRCRINRDATIEDIWIFFALAFGIAAAVVKGRAEHYGL
jgi:hypothetical protein